MHRVGEFEKVSYGQYCDVMAESIAYDDVQRVLEESYNALELPTRSTSGSAGYDFKSPISFSLEPNQSIKLPTGIRVKIKEGWWLGCLPRSGLGFKYRLQLDNVLGVIDTDYYFSDNEGHIFAKLTNDGKEGKIVHINAGDGFMQGIFLPYGVTYSDEADGVRNGGMGSTGA